MSVNWQDPSFLLSMIAIFGTIFTYFKHDRKIKAQEKLINDYQLGKIEQEKIQKKQAVLRASLIVGNKGHRILRIYNKGKAIARNVRLIIKDEPDNLYGTNPFPFPALNEHENVDIYIWGHQIIYHSKSYGMTNIKQIILIFRL
ncbi:hypothetical protein [Sphingobacterium endophyticum]|uniref:hypothetical protein n=1 Tax=Sphingobacterium endophyticum TaxID=2546448 RepID=UPI0012E2EB14|nr:hypothetical protein [Sphingobacterium endophyticum]